MEAAEFGAWLKSARKVIGKSAEKIAEEVGVSPVAVYGWEKGARPGEVISELVERAYGLPSDAIAAALSRPLSGGSLDYWVGRWEQSAAHLERVLHEQRELISFMKSKAREGVSYPPPVTAGLRVAEAKEPVSNAKLDSTVSRQKKQDASAKRRRKGAGE